MSIEADIRSTQMVYRSTYWKIHKNNIALASGVTADGRSIHGIGTSLISEEKALDAAVENFHHNARIADFSFEILKISGGNSNIRIDFLNRDGGTELKITEGKFQGRPTIEIAATREGRSVDAEAKDRGFSLPIVANTWQDVLTRAIDSAASQFERVGTTTVGDGNTQRERKDTPRGGRNDRDERQNTRRGDRNTRDERQNTRRGDRNTRDERQNTRRGDRNGQNKRQNTRRGDRNTRDERQNTRRGDRNVRDE